MQQFGSFKTLILSLSNVLSHYSLPGEQQGMAYKNQPMISSRESNVHHPLKFTTFLRQNLKLLVRAFSITVFLHLLLMNAFSAFTLYFPRAYLAFYNPELNINDKICYKVFFGTSEIEM